MGHSRRLREGPQRRAPTQLQKAQSMPWQPEGKMAHSCGAARHGRESVGTVSGDD